MPMPRPAKRPASYDDVLRAPVHLVAEIVDGDLYTSPRPGLRHTRAASRLGATLDGPFDRGRGGPGGWLILDEPELHIVEQVLVPDLAGWRRERVPQLPDEPHFTLAPDWICEVLSPGSEAFDRTLKLPRYAEAGVSHAWLVDPRSRAVEVYRLRGGVFQLVGQHEGDVTVRAEPFEAVELDLGALWAG